MAFRRDETVWTVEKVFMNYDEFCHYKSRGCEVEEDSKRAWRELLEDPEVEKDLDNSGKGRCAIMMGVKRHRTSYENLEPMLAVAAEEIDMPVLVPAAAEPAEPELEPAAPTPPQNELRPQVE